MRNYSETMGFDDEQMKLRHCNVWGCQGIMRPTKQLNDQDLPYTMRLFKCDECGNKNWWLAFPERDGSYGELHMLKGHEGHSGGSMLSDPCFYPPKKPFKGRRTK